MPPPPTLTRIIRAARTRLCEIGPPEAAYQTVMDAVAAVQDGRTASPDWLHDALQPLSWGDPTLPGWVHEAFHTADLDAVNARLEAGERLEVGQLARKTQLFTDAYMVDWLVDNSLGVIWQGMCERAGWSDPLEWPYRLPRALSADQRSGLPQRLSDLRILDPACGTGNFLLALLERLVAMHAAEAVLLGEAPDPARVAAHILTTTLAGVDIDSEALAVAEGALRRRAAALGASPGTLRLRALPAPLGALALTGGDYHLVIGNPPYLSTRLMSPALQDALPPKTHDLYAAFLRHAPTLCRPGGLCAMVTMRGWMFIAQFAPLRAHLLTRHRLTRLGDLAEGAFGNISGAVVSVVMSVIWRLPPDDRLCVVAAHQPTPAEKARALRTREALYTLAPSRLAVVPGHPLLYWWSAGLLDRYRRAPLLGETCPIRQGMATGNNARFLRRPWEVSPSDLWLEPAVSTPSPLPSRRFVPYVKGAAGQEWIEGLRDVIDWDRDGLTVKLMHEARYGSYTKRIPSASFFFRPAVCFTKIGARFSARAPIYRSIFDVAGSAAFPEAPADILCLLNSARARQLLEGLNPTVNFQVGDVRRLPVLPVAEAATIHRRLLAAWQAHAAVTETSPTFQAPGPSPWRWACQWAQEAVDRPDGAPLPRWSPQLTAPTAADHLSAALRALSRCPIFLDGAGGPDSLGRPDAAPLHAAWQAHPLGASLGDWLRLRFFPDDHLRRYASRPLLMPLSSARRTFVVFIHLHRWTPQTLPGLLTEHLRPALARLSRQSHPARSELADFIATVHRLATVGPDGAAHRQPFVPHIPDGVVVNSAALWPLLHPQWKSPKKWWRTGTALDSPRGFAWSRLALRHFPAAVRRLCEGNASLSAAHSTLADTHPGLAVKWGVREG